MAIVHTIHCSWCGKDVLRDARRVRESEKNNWKTFCNSECLRNSKLKGVTLQCSREGCSKAFFRKPSELQKIVCSYCSTRCAAIANNAKREKNVYLCANLKCKQPIDWSRKYCSNACIPIRESRYTKEVIIHELQSFYKKSDRIPVKQELMKLNQVARNQFGTWNNAIVAAGFDPNPVMFAKHYIAKDGHKCDSFAERIIDDFLFRRGITHERSYPYPGNKGFTVDFKIGEYWVEFFGLAGQHKRYDQLKRQKEDLAKKLKLHIISIYPKDIFPKSSLEMILKPIFSSNLLQ